MQFSLIEKIIFAVGLLATMVTLGIFVYTGFVYQKPLPTAAEGLQEFKEETSKVEVVENFKMKRFIVNIKSETKKLRFLELIIECVPYRPHHKEMLEKKEAIVRDAVIEVSSSMLPQDLDSVSGKIILEDRIRKRINQIYGKEIVKKIFFTKFVIQ